MVNKELFGDDECQYRDESAYRKAVAYARQFYEAGVFSTEDAYVKEMQLQKRELEMAKIQFRDERNEWNKQHYIGGRVTQKLNKLQEEISSIGRIIFNNVDVPVKESDNDLLCILSDLHIGQCFESAFGSYNSDIAKERLAIYLQEIFSIAKMNNSENCYVSIQGDLISNSIHKALAITNRENVIEQIKLASEYITSFCYELTKKFSNVYVSNVSGNHSRIDTKKDALEDERLDDLIGWTINNALKHIENFHWIGNNIDTSISCMDIRGKNMSMYMVITILLVSLA